MVKRIEYKKRISFYDSESISRSNLKLGFGINRPDRHRRSILERKIGHYSNKELIAANKLDRNNQEIVEELQRRGLNPA